MEAAILQSRSSILARGRNTFHKLKPDAEKGEKAWPLYLNNRGIPVGGYAEKWGKYVGMESRVYCKYPLPLEWGDEHNRPFDDFFIRCQKDYEFLPVDPNQPLSDHIVYRGMNSQLQERVRYNRCHVKHECYEEEARRNEQNRVSNLHGRATYTGGSRNMCRAMEQLKAQIIEDGGTPTMLKLYLGTHSSSVDKITGEFTYPDNSTKEYCLLVLDEILTAFML
ncbi:uncharacterized protein A4U43_C09F9040 [Asparagus officinalis]|uniref:Uncharacterized protein n=1 Tax=Asparagus officinalis TaxID=4686 RepID=A0A5P1E834_ASPOF|nr:uncharacterized protein A4U43_C09F9040 [Asparagus officinalis]